MTMDFHPWRLLFRALYDAGIDRVGVESSSTSDTVASP